MRQLPAGRFLLGYLLLVTAVITLAPFRFTRPVAPRLSWLVDLRRAPLPDAAGGGARDGGHARP